MKKCMKSFLTVGAVLMALGGRADGLVKGVISSASGEAPYPFLCVRDLPSDICNAVNYEKTAQASDLSWLPPGDPLPATAFAYHAWNRVSGSDPALYCVVTGLTPSAAYTVNIYVYEPFYSVYNARQFHATFNGTQDSTLIYAGYAGYPDSFKKYAPSKWTFTGKTADADGRISVSFVQVFDNPLFCAITVEGANLPAAPGTLTGEKSGNDAVLSWTAGATDVLGYRVESRIGESAWGEVAHTIGTTATVTMPSAPEVEYRVVATNGNGNVAGANTVKLAGPPARRYAVFCGDGEEAFGPFVPVFPFVLESSLKHDNNGTPQTASGEYAPYTAMYQRQALPVWPGMAFRFPGLAAGTTYKLRLHAIEPYFTAAGKRTFDIYANGTRLREAFDPFAEAGNSTPTYVDFDIAADADGAITCAVSNVVDKAIVCALEIFAADGEGLLAPPLRVIAGRTYNVIVPNAGCAADTYEVEVDDGTGARTLATGVAWKGCRDYLTAGGAVRAYRARISGNGIVGPWSDWVSAGTPTRYSDDPLRLMCCKGTPTHVPDGWTHDAPYRLDGNFSWAGGYGAGNNIVYPKGLADPAPREVMGSSLYGAYSSSNYDYLTHVIEGLDPTMTYRLRMHVAEDWSGITKKGGRYWRIGINSVAAIASQLAASAVRSYRASPDIDPWYQGGGALLTAGIVEHVGVRPDATGKLVLKGVFGSQNPLYRGLEILPEVAPAPKGVRGRNAWFKNGQSALTQSRQEVLVGETEQTSLTWTAADVPAGCDTGATRLKSRFRFVIPAAKTCAFSLTCSGAATLWLDGNRPVLTRASVGTAEVALEAGEHELFVSALNNEGVAFALSVAGRSTDDAWNLSDNLLEVTAPVADADWQWLETDNGYTPGYATFLNDGKTAVRISGAGRDMWGTVDGHVGLVRQMPRDFDCRVRVRSLSGRNMVSHSACGLWVGELPENRLQDRVTIFTTHKPLLANGQAGVGCWIRAYGDLDETDGVFNITDAGGLSGSTELRCPFWLRCRRAAGAGANGLDRLYFMYSYDERRTWTTNYVRDITVTAPLYVGPRVMAHDSNGELVTAEFDNLTCLDTRKKGMVLVFR